MTSPKTIRLADLFAGAGGTSTGALQAINRAQLGFDMLAVNHWPTAVKTHELNHPSVRHLCADLNSLDPLKCGCDNLDLLFASPECTHHSIARGGMPFPSDYQFTGSREERVKQIGNAVCVGLADAHCASLLQCI